MVLDNKSKFHFKEMQELISGSDELIITSPFLSPGICELMAGLGITEHIERITLVTVLASYEQALLKPPILYNFMNYCDTHDINWSIRIDETLHSKVYIFKNQGEPCKAVITSANFTINGLRLNHETGVVITDKEILKGMEYNLLEGSQILTANDVQLTNEAVLEYKKQRISKNKQREQFNPWDFVKSSANNPVIYPERDYYIKPVGYVDKPYIRHEPIDTNLYFSKQRPNIKPGDILICYAVGLQHILGYYEALQDPVRKAEESRWPWYITSQCLSPEYSSKFWVTDLTLFKVVADYNRLYPGEPVAMSGKTKLSGGMQFGKDKIKLDKVFAEYLISCIDIISMNGLPDSGKDEFSNDYIFMRLGWSETIEGEDINGEKTLQLYLEDATINGSTWFSTSVKGMSAKKIEHYNGRISAEEKIKILFAIDKVIAYSAEIMQVYSNDKPTLCPESGREPAAFSGEKQKTWIKIKNINPEKNISVGRLQVIKNGRNVKEVIDKSQCCFAYVKKITEE